jgi:transposase
MDSYTEAAMERAMKVQEVILQAMSKKITWWQAAEILGISDRHMRRWRERYEEFGFRGLFDRRRGRPSPKRVPVAIVERVLELYRERYFDLNVRHFHEKLGSAHQIGLSYSWVKGILQGSGLVARGRKRGVHRQRRPRRPLPGMLLHIDGSRHRWLGDERWHDLIVILDDASGEIYYAQLVQEESTQPGTAFTACRRQDLERVFSLQFERTVNRDNTVSFQNLCLQIQPVRWRGTLAGCAVSVHQHLDGTLSLRYGPHLVGRYNAQGGPLLEPKVPRRKAVEKPLRGKPKAGFPLRLEIPQQQPDSHFPTATAATND